MQLESGCWEFLGLGDEWIREIAVTPWGLFIGTEDSGVFRLERNGRWTNLGPSVWNSRMIPRALLYVPADPPRLLAGLTFRHDSNDTTRAAVYASFDGGDSWEPFDGGLGAGSRYPYRVFVDDLEVDPHDPQRVFMSNCHGVLRSMDAGGTWVFVLGGFDLCGWNVDVLVDPESTGRVWVAGQGNVFNPRVALTLDWGETWEGAIPGCGDAYYETPVHALALDRVLHDRLYAGTDVGLMRSDQAGVQGSWECVGGPQGAVVGFAELVESLYAVTVDVEYTTGADGRPVQRAELGLFRLPDGGSSWEMLTVPEGAGGATTAAVDPEGHKVLIGTRAGLWALRP